MRLRLAAHTVGTSVLQIESNSAKHFSTHGAGSLHGHSMFRTEHNRFVGAVHSPSPDRRGVTEILGAEPLHIAWEGTILIAVGVADFMSRAFRHTAVAATTEMNGAVCPIKIAR